MARPALISNRVGTNPIIISERQCPALTFDHVGTPLTTLLESPSTHIHQPMLKRLSTYTWPCEEPILHVERICTYIWKPMSERITIYSRPCAEPFLHAERLYTCIWQPMTERLNTYIWHMRGTNPTYMFKKALHLHSTHARNQSNMHVQKGSALTSAHARNQSSMHVRRALYLHLHMRGTNLACMSKGLALTSDHVGTNPIVILDWPPVPDWATW